MASRLSVCLLLLKHPLLKARATAQSLLRRSLVETTRRSHWSSSSDAPPPPILLQLQSDLKDAMRARDVARLAVVRGLLTQITNISHTATPATTDVSLVKVLRKQLRAAQDAEAHFRAAGREDLAEKEGAQVAILHEYVTTSGLRTVSTEELRAMVMKLVADASEAENQKPGQLIGHIMSTLCGPGQGLLEGKDVNKAEVIAVVREALSQRSWS